MRGATLRPEVQALFDRYLSGTQHVRRLGHVAAIQLLENEFSLSEKAARSIIDYFDTDRNGSLSIWEFQHFYNLAGPRVTGIAAQFDNLDKEGRGFLDKETMVMYLKDMKSADGTPLEDKDVDIIMKTARNEEKIGLGDFMAMLYRVKQYRKSK